MWFLHSAVRDACPVLWLAVSRSRLVYLPHEDQNFHCKRLAWRRRAGRRTPSSVPPSERLRLRRIEPRRETVAPAVGPRTQATSWRVSPYSDHIPTSDQTSPGPAPD